MVLSSTRALQNRWFPATVSLATRPEETVATISWISTTGGDWSDGANWSGGVVPGAADDAVMALSNAETITISTAETVQAVSFDDPAATFIETATGTLVAAGDVAIDAASVDIGGPLDAGGNVTIDAAASIDIGGPLVAGGALSGAGGGTVTLSTLNSIANLGTIEEAGTLVAGALSGTVSVGAVFSPANTIAALGTFGPAGGFIVGGPAVISPSSGPTISLGVVGAITTDWLSFGAPYQPIITVAPQNGASTPELIVSTVPAAAALTPFATGEAPAGFLNGPLPGASPEWARAMPSHAFGGGVAMLAGHVPTITGAGDGAVVSATGYRSEVLAAGAGNETLIAGAGNDTMAAGNGSTEMIGGAGNAIFQFVNGAAGGTVTIENFVSGRDFVTLRDYGFDADVDALATEVVVGGSATVTLPDHSRITFANVASLTVNDFR
jgi:hypothetical protein